MLNYKTLLIDAICGVGLPSVLFADECAKVGLATYVGPLGSEYVWNRAALAATDDSALEELYQTLRERYPANDEPPARIDTPEIILCQ